MNRFITTMCHWWDLNSKRLNAWIQFWILLVHWNHNNLSMSRWEFSNQRNKISGNVTLKGSKDTVLNIAIYAKRHDPFLDFETLWTSITSTTMCTNLSNFNGWGGGPPLPREGVPRVSSRSTKSWKGFKIPSHEIRPSGAYLDRPTIFAFGF